MCIRDRHCECGLRAPEYSSRKGARDAIEDELVQIFNDLAGLVTENQKLVEKILAD